MKTKIKLLIWLVLILGATNAWAEDFVMESGEHLGALALFNYDTLLMTGGIIENLTLSDYAVATIENTDLLIGILGISTSSYGVVNIHGGGIGDIESWAGSTINVTGGSVNYLKMQQASMSYLYGGQINTLASDQMAFWQPTGEPDLNGWIQLFCREYDYDTNTRILTGVWGDYSDFSIQLQDIGTIPTYDQIEFHIIPEPGAIILLGLGGIFLKRRASKQYTR